VIVQKRAEYLALCAIAQDSAQICNNLRITAQQQALMADGGAGAYSSLPDITMIFIAVDAHLTFTLYNTVNVSLVESIG
jgi:hypothetical protein